MFPCLTPDRDNNMREQQARFRLGRVSNHQASHFISHLKVFKHRRPKIIAFLFSENVCDQVALAVLSSILYWNGVSVKFVKLPEHYMHMLCNGVQWTVKSIRDEKSTWVSHLFIIV